jgi:hypothetical protein
MGISWFGTLKTTMSPGDGGVSSQLIKSISPLKNEGSIDPLKNKILIFYVRTTTTGDSLFIINIKPFHIMSAELITVPSTTT